MQTAIQSPARPKAVTWVSYTLSGLSALFLLFDGVTKLMNVAPVQEAMAQLGYPASSAPVIGVITLVCLVLYLLPATSVLGAVLVTGLLGGAVASQLRVEAPMFSMVFPILIGAMFWGGLFLRDERLRALFPLRR